MLLETFLPKKILAAGLNAPGQAENRRDREESPHRVKPPSYQEVCAKEYDGKVNGIECIGNGTRPAKWGQHTFTQEPEAI